MRTSTLCPFPAGAALFRDPRNWHGATPNLSESPRSVPAAVFSAPWLNVPAKRAMPRAVFEALVRCRRIHLPPLCLLLLLLLLLQLLLRLLLLLPLLLLLLR